MSTDTASNNLLRCIVVTPEETVLEGEASFVALPLFDGEIGIARGHSPMIGRLGFGEMRSTGIKTSVLRVGASALRAGVGSMSDINADKPRPSPLRSVFACAICLPYDVDCSSRSTTSCARAR